MSCNSVIHDELEKTGDNTCPFCGKQLVNVKNFKNLLSHAVVNKRL